MAKILKTHGAYRFLSPVDKILIKVSVLRSMETDNTIDLKTYIAILNSLMLMSKEGSDVKYTITLLSNIIKRLQEENIEINKLIGIKTGGRSHVHAKQKADRKLVKTS